MLEQIVRGPLLMPTEDGKFSYLPDGALAADSAGTLRFAGDFRGLGEIDAQITRASDGVMLPPLLDIHIHVPQHPIRGRFCDGVGLDCAEGRLLAGLKRNVFPAEAKCSVKDFARVVARDFLGDTLSNGVVGGAAYMTVSATATESALEILPDSWSVGLVLMNQNCPENLRTDQPNLTRNVTHLANRFGPRLIVTDRFAVSVDTPLRRRAVELASRFGLRTQTHLNEQTHEKHFVEKVLYPDAKSYTEVYLRDGLLDHRCILAHCIHMRPEEWRIVAQSGSVVAHCPTSNQLLGSGMMPLEMVFEHRIPWAIGTDVGASPTVSLFAEMKRFMDVHQGKSARATAEEALWRCTVAPARILGLENQLGQFAPGKPMSFIEAQPIHGNPVHDSEKAICSLLPQDVDNPAPSVARVTLNGKPVFNRIRAYA